MCCSKTNKPLKADNIVSSFFNLLKYVMSSVKMNLHFQLQFDIGNNLCSYVKQAPILSIVYRVYRYSVKMVLLLPIITMAQFTCDELF